MSTDSLEAQKQGVQKAYTEAQVVRRLRHFRASGMSLRQIARDVYGDRLTHGDIQRALAGVFPKGPNKREAMNLPPFLPAPACHRCGKVHVTRRCTEHLRNREYRDLWDMPVAELRRRLEQRTEF
jgi:hypothetical protein